MSCIPEPIEKLVRELNGLPGLGVKTAYRIAFYIADSADVKADNFSEALKQVKERIKICRTCFGYSLDDDCRICSDTSRDKKSGGSGLGLAIAKIILDLHDGKIKVFSKINEGTEVQLIFDIKETIRKEKEQD